jgi:hypothetical protein
MKNGKSLVLSISILFFVLLSGCKKEEATSTSCATCPAGGGIAAPPDGFTYTTNQGAVITADSAFLLNSNVIISYYHGAAHRVTIKLTSLLAGTYALTNPSNGNTVSYYETPGATYNATGGTVTISESSSTKISGSFVTSGAGGGFVNVNGQFQNIKKHL